MKRCAPVRMTWLLGAVAAAIAVTCKSSTTPHQPTPCPSYSGGLSQGDSLYGLYQLVSYCLDTRSEEHTSEIQSQSKIVCRLLLEKKKKQQLTNTQPAQTVFTLRPSYLSLDTRATV